ncbi:MAG: hypothetical protein FGM40_08550 [Rhodocyclaceae bacterium]|nr:hypothetical protein [Rhodocyclaceae bacterium]
MRRTLLALLLMALPMAACAVSLVVLEARGGGLSSGQAIPSDKPITLKEGERVTVIGPDGKSVTLRGPFNGPPMPGSGAAADPKLALAALVATRDARTSSVGVIRAGTDAAKLPEPWLIDMSRPGPRCLLEGERPVWWRPEAAAEQNFTVYPVDRSWRADFLWKAGEDRQPVPPLSRFEGQNNFVISVDKQEHAISITTVPKGIENDFVLTSWMLQKGCVQQADALIRKLGGTPAAP